MNTEKNEILAVAAHDLKNPIGSVLGMAQLLLNPSTPDSARKQCMTQIFASSQKMLNLVTHLLDIGKIETSGNHPLYEPIDVADLLRKTIAQNSWAAQRKSIDLKLYVDPIPEYCYTDASTLVEIIDNLVSNAIKFSLPDSAITVSATQKDERFVLTVSDQGPGISEEDRTHLFSKFAHLSARPTGGESSTGLGLYIAKRLVDGLKGSIRCESVSGEGTSFIVEIPINAGCKESVSVEYPLPAHRGGWRTPSNLGYGKCP